MLEERGFTQSSLRWADRVTEKKGRERKRAGSGVGVDGDVNGTCTEGADQEPGEAADATDGLELELIAGGEIEIECLPIPAIVDAQLMPAGSDWKRYGVTVHEFSDALTIKLHNNLAELDIFRRGATDGDLRPGGWWLRRESWEGQKRTATITCAVATS
jgi:hypothetical protein